MNRPILVKHDPAVNDAPSTLLLKRARRLAQLADTLHAECCELTLPAGALAVLAKDTASHANAILDLIQAAQWYPGTVGTHYAGVPLKPVVVANTIREASDVLLGEGRR